MAAEPATILTIVKDLVVVLGFPITAAGLLFAAFQFRQTVNWNRLNATFSLFGNKSYGDAAGVVSAELARLGVSFHDLKDPLTDAQVDVILQDAAAYGSVKSFLNYLEDYSTALHVGVLHRATAYYLMGYVITQYFKAFEPLIKRRRLDLSQERTWAELELAHLEFDKLFKQDALSESENYIARLMRSTAKEYYKGLGNH